MGIQFEIFSEKKKFPTDRPIPVKQGRVRGNKNTFKVGLMAFNIVSQRAVEICISMKHLYKMKNIQNTHKQSFGNIYS